MWSVSIIPKRNVALTRVYEDRSIKKQKAAGASALRCFARCRCEQGYDSDAEANRPDTGQHKPFLLIFTCGYGFEILETHMALCKQNATVNLANSDIQAR